MGESFSVEHRAARLERMSSELLDVLIIGGGITGAGIAWDASRRGLRTGLVEMGDFAQGTSSRSTKLVHGGLRYLKQGEVKLVAEVGRERALLHKHAPHVVTPTPMLMPVYKGGTYGYLASSIGLYIYDRLAGVKRAERRKMYRREQTEALEPLLKREGLRGSGYYYEYRTDDARLTLEVMKTAHRHGAEIVNYAKVEEMLYRDGVVCGARIADMRSGKHYDVYARKIVNAAGPWVDHVRRLDGEVTGKRLLLTKGVHLVVDSKRLPVQQAVYIDVPDGRMIFIIPRDGKTYIGTTDTFYHGDPGSVVTTRADRDYLLHAANAAFPEAKLKAADVESCWAGVRPLIHEDGKSPSEISRKDEMFISEKGLITIAGGKLTGFRKMAEKVVDLVADEIKRGTGRKFGRCTTGDEMLSGGDYGGYHSFDELQKELLSQGLKLGVPQEDLKIWVARYGSNAAQLLARYAALREAESGNSGVAAGAAGGVASAGLPGAGSAGVSAGAGASVLGPAAKAVNGRITVSVGFTGAAGASASGQAASSPAGASAAAKWDRALRAELDYAIEEEMTCSAVDFLVRRTSMILFDRKRAETLVQPILHLMGQRFGWNDAQCKAELARVQAELKAVTEFPEFVQE
ncbi:glycerol-3-phosphate dehydrogenase/oxidase [Paenibacillus lignilyticus]|uniref:Glycerol-3-phosphate dehydrogenase n=1 Tax=Paenibacillus lignilyticus TaxID=1172615 RepID=A0ABS5CKM3_9BACL|nr:glycerol-3-phosphate dehydrogenase/oxidase [Paenibacillus lignilyticus]MBP3966371.1 glycerol-3-phosphate dehydrogenase/oxidase [Paenibacillus lignilyticus]